MLQEPGGVAYQIYDQTGIDLFRHGRDYPATMVEAQTIAELAAKIGIEPAVLVDESKVQRGMPKGHCVRAGKPDGKCTGG